MRVAIVISDCLVADRFVRAMENPCTGCKCSCLVVLDNTEQSASHEMAKQWLDERVKDPDEVLVLFDRHGGMDKMLEDTTIDAVYIITPPAKQHTCIMKSLQAKKHVLVFDATSTPLSEFVPELDCAIKMNRFLQSSTMFVHHHRVQTFLDSVNADDFGTIETINIVLSIYEDDCALVGIQLPLGPGDGCIRRLGRFCVLISVLLFTRGGSRPVSALVQDCEGPAEQPTSAKCVVTFSDDRVLQFSVGYSEHAATRQILEVQARDRYATMTDFVIPHPDGLANYRIYDKELVRGKLEVVRGECLDVLSGPPQDVMMWRRFSSLCKVVEQQGYESKEATSSVSLSNMSIQTKQLLLALEESLETKKEVPIVVQDFETMRKH
jgi:hypothetical protein